jgi:hypothetical protein
MPAKKLRVSPVGLGLFNTIPGNTADFNSDQEMLDDTIFGHSFKSMQPDITTWSVSGNAIYKGFSGYQVIIKKTGLALALTNEAMVLVSSQTYMVTDISKRIFDYITPIVIKVGGVDKTIEVLNIDYLYGKVTFKSTFVVSGAVTVTGKYVPSSQICAMNKYSLTQQADSIDETDLCIAQSNGGYRQFKPGIKTVSLELNGFFKVASGFQAALKTREKFVIDINPDGIGNSLCRGFFSLKSAKQSGKVAALEEESISLELYVPDIDLLASPFSWSHTPTSTLNTAIRSVIDAWQNETLIDVRYLHDGLVGYQGSSAITNLSLSGGLGSLNEFALSFKGSGGITVV